MLDDSHGSGREDESDEAPPSERERPPVHGTSSSSCSAKYPSLPLVPLSSTTQMQVSQQQPITEEFKRQKRSQIQSAIEVLRGLELSLEINFNPFAEAIVDLSGVSQYFGFIAV
jgi:hypothetical protein